MKNYMKQITYLMIIAILGSLVFVLINVSQGFALPSLLNPRQASVSVSPPILQSIRQLGQLTSTSAQLATADLNVNVRWGIGNVCNITARHVSRGTIEAGVDLMQVSSDNVRFDEGRNTYTVTLPQPGLTNCIIDPIATQQYQVSGTSVVCTVNRDELRRVASYEALNQFRDDAIEEGILQRAALDTELLLTNFISSLTGADVEINFRDEEQPLPLTCRPSAPHPWYYDEQINRWRRD